MPNAVPITEPFPYQCASSYFSRIRHLDAPVWLDSGVLFASETNNQTQTETGHRTGRFDILAAQPLSVCRDQQTPPDNSPSLFERAQHMLNRLSPTTANEHPFHGGLIGSFAYETNHQRFGMASKRQPALTSWFGLYAWALVIDHKTRRASLVSHPDCPTHALEQARHCLSHSTSFNSEFQLQSPFYASQTEAEFCKNVATIKDYLHAGDCYQVNLAQHFSASFSGDAYHAYLALRSCSPTPFGGFLDTGDHCILSCSPEEFLCITPEVVSTQPIKGTRRATQTQTKIAP